MLICKQPRIGARVPPHRDSEFLYTDPPSAVGWWIALQDASKENGTLGFWKGSHRRRIERRFVRSREGQGTEFVKLEEGRGLPLDVSEEEEQEGRVYEATDEDFELVDVPAGSLVLIHGNVLHTSEKNQGDKSRFAYTFHVIEGADGWVYDERNWLQPPEQGFTRLYS
jgi:ectoine hydroxylase-related dioxygenase (phytanoyl-CoA dioxygenase family)